MANAILFARYCACIFSLLSIALVAHIGARLFDGRTGVAAALLLREKPFTAVDGMMRASNIMDSKTSGDTSGVNWFKENRHRNDANKIIYEAVAP